MKSDKKKSQETDREKIMLRFKQKCLKNITIKNPKMGGNWVARSRNSKAGRDSRREMLCGYNFVCVVKYKWKYFKQMGAEMDYVIKKISESPEWRDVAAIWFSSKWSVPLEAYQASMNEAVMNAKMASAVPEWYIVMLRGGQIIAGCGVIENDFHKRKDLRPNLCAVYVNEQHRCMGLAGELLNFVCSDMKSRGEEVLYLITDHVGFYERYGWEFHCMVENEGADDYETSRMYIHR